MLADQGVHDDGHALHRLRQLVDFRNAAVRTCSPWSASRTSAS